MDAPHAFEADDLAAIVTVIDALNEQLGLDYDVIDFDKIASQTALTAERARSLLEGETEERPLHDLVKERLEHLRDKRRRPDGKKYSFDEIAAGAKISKAQVSAIWSGKRKPGFPVVVDLEKFFGVESGYLSRSERKELAIALEPIQEQLTHLALLRGVGISQLALRSSLTSSNDRLGREVREALAMAVQKPIARSNAHGGKPHESPVAQADLEIRELARRIESLPNPSKKRVIPVLRSLLGLARPEKDEPKEC